MGVVLQNLASRSLLAALALALAIGAGLASGSETAAAESADESTADDSATITTTLHPGWNLIGWVGPETPVADLFGEIPALQRVSARDARAGAYLRARRSGGSATGALRLLTPGMGLWFLVGGNETIEWTRPGAAESALLQLYRGFNLVAWLGGPDSLEDGLARLGDDLVRASRWNPQAQRYETHDPGRASSASVLDAVAPGDGLRIEVNETARWWQQGAAAPPVVFADDLDSETAFAIATAYQRARGLFTARFGIPETAEITAHVYADEESLGVAYHERHGRNLAPGRCVYRVGSELHHSASCYGEPESRIGQRYFGAATQHIAPRTQVPAAEAGYSPYGPIWLLLGTDAYMDAAYRETFGDESQPVGQAGTAALAFVAATWLAGHAGDGAFFEYYRLLPSSTSWQDAFERAFGISVTNFRLSFGADHPDTARHLPQLADAPDEPVFVFVGDIAADLQDELRVSLNATRDLFETQFDGRASAFTVYIGSDLRAIRPVYLAVRGYEDPALCGDYAHGAIFQIISCKNPELVLAHEYVHVLQNELAEGASGDPAWLAEGVAVYGEALHRALIGQRLPTGEGFELRRRWELARVMLEGDVPTLSNLETVDDPNERSHYHLGFIAADWLAGHAGVEALAVFYQRLPSSENWEEAFEGAFDLTVDDFYTTFEDYWPEIEPLLPHLADDREGPVVVFLGDIDSSGQAAHESAVGKVEALFSERFGVESVESTVFVGADVESLEPIHWMLFEDAPHTNFCSGRHGPAFVYAASCDDPLARHLSGFYFILARDKLAPWSELPGADDGYSRRGPQWLDRGTYLYAELLSGDAAGIADYGDERATRIKSAQANPADPRSLETAEGWNAANEADQSGWALSFLAVERLAELAGDEAVFEYFRLLPSSTSWREAFEGAFGLTVDDFYEDFEVHQADIAPVLPQVRGVVLGPDGEPVEGAGLWLRWHSATGAYIEFARTEADGTFRFAARDGSYRLTLMEYFDGDWVTYGQYGGPTGFSTGSITVIEVDEADVTDIVIRLPSPLSELRPIP
ncbi:MAG: carboxypeptidase regulatory-like domain-containing protein [Chloroflexi bacterium]|nr:carboxypeptidase regulatory-like domain-containing protein [Chloroflexota bacterium]